jgi:hypothetical protein
VVEQAAAVEHPEAAVPHVVHLVGDEEDGVGVVEVQVEHLSRL